MFERGLSFTSPVCSIDCWQTRCLNPRHYFHTPRIRHCIVAGLPLLTSTLAFRRDSVSAIQKPRPFTDRGAALGTNSLAQGSVTKALCPKGQHFEWEHYQRHQSR